MPRTIQVTHEHIASGVRYSACFCPVAQAVSEAVGSRVEANRLTIIVGGVLFIETPQRASAFIEAFDGGAAVSPMTFDLQIPGEP